MSLIPRDKLFDFDHPFNQFFRGFPAMQEADDFFAPRVEVRDNDKSYVITAEMPGVDRDDLHVTLENGTLTIEGSTEDESREEKEGKVIRSERRYGKYSRSFHVGEGVTEADIEASFKDGVLKLEVPKKDAPVPEKRRIDIR